MRRSTLAIVIAAALVSAACLQKDTTSTIYLRPDGSFDWVVVERNVRSDEADATKRVAEEAGYVDTINDGDHSIAKGFLALGAEDVRVGWLRRRRPYAVLIDAGFDSLSGALDRALGPCGIPYESRTTESEGVVTWTLRADVGVDGARLAHDASESCGDAFEGMTDALDELQFILESGSFTAATGFVLKGADIAAVDDAAVEESVRSTGLVELSLSWR